MVYDFYHDGHMMIINGYDGRFFRGIETIGKTQWFKSGSVRIFDGWFNKMVYID